MILHVRVLPVAKRKSRRGHSPGHVLKKVCKKAKETRDTANSASSGTLQSWHRASRFKYKLEKSCFFLKKYVFCKKHGRSVPRGRRPLRVALLLPLSMRVVSGFFYFCKLQTFYFFVLSQCYLLRRDPRTSFFAFFSEGFRTRACKDFIGLYAQKRVCCNVEKVCACLGP